ncbi:MAG: glycoside hydrolase 5 family protein [Limisphaerales bacterium]
MKPSLFRGALLGGLISCFVAVAGEKSPPRWTVAKANSWQKKTGWLVGCNYAPATAINQLEMWQADTFDLATIDRELGWASSIGFNSVRVFLHHLLWEQDARGLLQRMEQFLKVADRHGIGVMFVPFDGVWDPFPQPGKQRDPKPHVHNSGWVQSPGLEILKDPARHGEMKPYLQGILRHFRKDKRIHAWDLFNEPDNPNRSAYGTVELTNKAGMATMLLRELFVWAREVKPVQPLTAGVWVGTWDDPAKLNEMERLCLDQSDIITFHNYGSAGELQHCIANLRRYQRPILCTEYMSRGNGSFFDPHLGFMRAQNVGAYNWGLVAGKSQTIYPWETWTKTYTAEPALWFHDLFRADGTPYDPKEIEYLRQVTGKR